MIFRRIICCLIGFLCIAVSVFAETEKPVIGLMSEMSGPFAANGELCRAGYQTALRIFEKQTSRKVPFELVYADHQGDAMVGVREFKKLLETDAAIAVISPRSQVGMALNPLSKNKKIPLLGIVGHAEFVRGNPFAFRFWPEADVEAQVLTGIIRADGSRTALSITMEDEWTMSMTERFSAKFTAAGGQALLDVPVSKNETDFSAVALKVRSVKPDAVFVNLGIGANGAVIRKLKESGYQGKIYSNYWVQNAAEIEAIEGVKFVEIDLSHPEFDREFEAVFSRKQQSSMAYLCYAALSFVLAATHQPGDVREPAVLYERLRALHTLQLADESVAFADREIQLRPVCKIIRNGVAALC